MRKINDEPIRMIHQDRTLGDSFSVNPLETLERRLNDGYLRIEEATSRGEDVTAWEDFWIDLLRQYEVAADDLPEAA